MKTSKLILLSSLLALGFVSFAFAQESDLGFTGPGGCTSKEECRAYCDIDSNKEECLTFAIEHGMMTEAEAERARKFLNQTGPGGCRGEECKTYCEDPANTETCLNFAVENGMITAEQAERMKKFRAIEEKGGPGGCRRDECRTYCEDEVHQDECFDFAKENGLIGEKEIEGFETGKKIREQLKAEGGPGGCKDERECHDYCSDSSKMEECVAFGAKATGKSPEEIRRMLDDFKSGEMDRGRFERGEFQGPHSSPEGFERFREKGEEFKRRMMEEKERMMRSREEMMQRGDYPRPENTEQYRDMKPTEEMMRMMQRPEGESMPMPTPAEYQMRPPEGYQMMPPSNYQQYPQPTQQYSEPMRTSSEPTYTTPPSTMSEPAPSYSAPPPTMEAAPAPMPAPTSYDHSRSFLANVWAAFLAPFRR